jgi:hypothetical protein
VTIPAGVVGFTGKIAAVALFDMATKGRRAAGLDGPHDAQLLIGERVGCPVSGAVLSKDVGHFQSGPWHPELFPGFLL